MNIFFRHLLTLGFDHPFYAQSCRDFRFFVPEVTRDLMQRGKLIAREGDGVLHVLYEARDDGMRLADLTGRTLLFGLHLANPSFDNFTEPPIVGRGMKPFYANATTPGSMDPPLRVQVVAGLYSHAPQEDGRPVKLTLSGETGNVVASQVLAAPGPAPAFDLRALPDGLWTVTEDYGAGPVHPRRILLDAELMNANVWGLAAIKVANGFYAAPPALAVEFTARAETLAYYVVAPKLGDTEFAQLDVADAGFTQQGRPEVKFRKVPQAEWPGDPSPAQLGAEPERIALFASLAAVPRREKSLRRIQLERNGDILVEHLPQPGAQQSRPQFVIHLSKP